METSIVNNIRFIEVNIFPPLNEKYFQLFENGIARNLIFSESHLKKSLSILISNYDGADSNKG